MDSALTLKLISRVLHFLATGYIVAYLGVYFWAMTAVRPDTLHVYITHTYNLTAGIVVTLSGILGVALILYQKTHPL